MQEYSEVKKTGLYLIYKNGRIREEIFNPLINELILVGYH